MQVAGRHIQVSRPCARRQWHFWCVWLGWKLLHVLNKGACNWGCLCNRLVCEWWPDVSVPFCMKMIGLGPPQQQLSTGRQHVLVPVGKSAFASECREAGKSTMRLAPTALQRCDWAVLPPYCIDAAAQAVSHPNHAASSLHKTVTFMQCCTGRSDGKGIWPTDSSSCVLQHGTAVIPRHLEVTAARQPFGYA